PPNPASGRNPNTSRHSDRCVESGHIGAIVSTNLSVQLSAWYEHQEENMAEPQQSRRVESGRGPKRVHPALPLKTRGWQVADIPGAMELEKSAFVALTEQDESAVILNCYQPGQKDAMHCHP